MESLYELLKISSDSSMREIGNAIENVMADDNVGKETKDRILSEARKFMEIGREKYDEMKFDIENEQSFAMVNNHQPTKPKPHFGIIDDRAKLREIRRRKRKQALYQDKDVNNNSFRNSL